MSMQKILSSMRKAINEYDMISDGDNVTVGLSGGKDSVTLLAALAAYRRFSPKRFTLKAITVDMGLDADFTPLCELCEKLEVEYKIVKTDIAEIIFDVRKEKSPCSLCSKMRRGALNTAITKNGGGKLALGHHADDVAETFMLSLFYEGRLSTFAPVSYMSRTGVTLIRPFVLTEEKDIIPVSKDYPTVKNPCPVNHVTQREYMKELLKKINSDIPCAKTGVLTALFHPERNNLWDRIKKS